MFITYKNVKEYVQRAEPESIVGKCGYANECLIARAVRQKYPDLVAVSVSLDSDKREIFIVGSYIPGYGESLTTGDDNRKLWQLANDFDDYGFCGKEVTRESALALMEDADDYAEDIREPAVSHHVTVPA